jgi:hypothetical protein
MPWKECSVMDERVRFVARLLKGRKWRPSVGSSLSLVRRAIRSLTAIRIRLEALTDRSSRPWRYCNQLPPQVETAIVNLKQEKPHWGARRAANACCDAFPVRLRFPPAAPSTSPTADVSVSTAKNQFHHRLRGLGCRYQGTRGRYLAAQLYGLRSRIHRSGGKNSAGSRKSI